jgi:hypothetical protein
MVGGRGPLSTLPVCGELSGVPTDDSAVTPRADLATVSVDVGALMCVTHAETFQRTTAGEPVVECEPAC